jgi:regulator of protease activity HflC (stomatin/prohibitin superfamily)
VRSADWRLGPLSRNHGFDSPEVGLRYRHGRYERLLEPGGHWLIGPAVRVDGVDSRRGLLVVSSQEVLTSDSVQLRLSAVVAFRVADPPHAIHDLESYEQELHVAVQLALRTSVGEATAEDLLARRLEFGNRLIELVSERASALGLEVFAIDLRDVMLPGDVKAAFAEVLRARAEGRAALEPARGESADPPAAERTASVTPVGTVSRARRRRSSRRPWRSSGCR